MSHPYPPAPRKLERSRTNRMLGGVCGGLATYLNMDPTLVRVLAVLISLFTGVPVIVYLILLLVVPEEEAGAPGAGPSAPPVGADGSADALRADPASVHPVGVDPVGADPGRVDPIWGAAGAPWEQPSAQPVEQPTAEQPAADPKTSTAPPDSLR